MKQLSNNDHASIVRILRWAAVQGGCSTLDANKRRMASKLLKKMQHEENYKKKP